MIIDNKEYTKIDDNYYISKYGDIYSVRSKRYLKHYINIDGYHRVDLYKKHKKIHILVYRYWIGDIPKGYQVNHKDDDKDNNYIENLYLGTQKENIHDCMNNNHHLEV